MVLVMLKHICQKCQCLVLAVSLRTGTTVTGFTGMVFMGMSMVMAFIRNGFLVVLMLFAHTMDDFYWQLFATEVLGGMTMMAMATYEFRKYKRKRMLIGV